MASLHRILHVDDEPDIQAVAVATLEMLGGFTVCACASGSAAVAAAAEFAPDLILLDVMMPGLDGPLTLRELRKFPALASVPVIFMTAKVQPHELDHYLNLGAAGIIAKPFDPMTLCDQVRDLWTAVMIKDGDQAAAPEG